MTPISELAQIDPEYTCVMENVTPVTELRGETISLDLTEWHRAAFEIRSKRKRGQLIRGAWWVKKGLSFDGGVIVHPRVADRGGPCAGRKGGAFGEGVGGEMKRLPFMLAAMGMAAAGVGGGLSEGQLLDGFRALEAEKPRELSVDDLYRIELAKAKRARKKAKREADRARSTR